MKLIKDCGLIPKTDRQDIMELMVEAARLFFKAGGILTFNDWSELEESEKAAFIMARESFSSDIREIVILQKSMDMAASRYGRN